MSSKPTDDQNLYLLWTDDKIRFNDLDRYGHLNNVTFATYSESARTELLELVAPGSTEGKGNGWVIAKLAITFLAAGYYPATVRVGTRVARVGNSSISLEQGLYSNGKLLARMECVMVWADIKTETSVPISDEVRQRLAKYQTPNRES